MKNIKTIPFVSAGILIAASNLLPLSADAQTKRLSKANKKTSTPTLIKRQLSATKNKKLLSQRDLSSYKNFKMKLAPLVKTSYRSQVRKVDNNFVEGVLKPIYNNLIYAQIKLDKKFGRDATLKDASATLGITNNGEILLYQKVSFNPKKVRACTDKQRSTNTLCLQGKRVFKEINSQYDRKLDQSLERGIKKFKSSYKKNKALARALNGWNISSMSTVEAAYAALAAMPQRRERGSRFFPAIALAYAIPADKGGRPSATPGENTPTTPNPTFPGENSPGNVNPGSIRSMINFWDPTAKSSLNIYEGSPKTLVATTGLNKLSTPEWPEINDKRLAWSVTNQGRNTNYQLVNGFTNSRRATISDRWNIACVDYNRWWPGCTQYWFGFEINYGYVYGIRAGFNVNTTATLSNTQRREGNMTITMNTGNMGADIYRSARLKQNYIYDGKEFLARVCQRNSCSIALLGDLPGPDPLSTRFTRWTIGEIDFLKRLPTCLDIKRRYGDNTQCSAIDSMRNGEFTWPNAGRRVNLARWVSNYDLFAGQLDYGIVGVEANPYAAVNINGKGYRQKWYTNRNSRRRINANDSNLSFRLNNLPNRSNPVVTGSDNEYDFNFAITPGIALKGSAAGYGLGPWYIDLDALAINTPNFTLYRHNGTYNGAWTGVPR